MIRKIFDKCYRGIMVILLAAIAVILRYSASSNNLSYGIGCILIAITIVALNFIYNKYKKPLVRRWYLATMIAVSVAVLVQCLFFLITSHVYSDFLNTMFYWLVNISEAAFLACLLFFLFADFKDFFKKGYEVGKIDAQGFLLAINSFIYIALFFINFATFRYSVAAHYDSTLTNITFLSFTFDNFKDYLLVSIIAVAAYLIAYAIIEFICYYFFEKEKEDKNQRPYN